MTEPLHGSIELVDGSLEDGSVELVDGQQHGVSDFLTHDDITFDLDISGDMLEDQVTDSQPITVQVAGSKPNVPSIMITEPSSVCLVGEEENVTHDIVNTNEDLSGSDSKVGDSNKIKSDEKEPENSHSGSNDDIIVNDQNNKTDENQCDVKVQPVLNNKDNDTFNDSTKKNETDVKDLTLNNENPDNNYHPNTGVDIVLNDKSSSKNKQTFESDRTTYTKEVDEKGDKNDIHSNTGVGGNEAGVDDNSTVDAMTELINSVKVPDTVRESMDDSNRNEVGDMISLDNILVQDKAGSDSDSEFDFDLPTPTQTTQTKVKPAITQPTPTQTTQTNVKPALTQPASTNTSRSEDKHSIKVSPSTPAAVLKPVAIIKPNIVSTVSENVTQESNEPVDDQRAAQDEWENVRTIQAGFGNTSTSGSGSEPAVVSSVQAISTHELVQYLKQENFSSVKGGITPVLEKHGFAAFVNFLFGPPKLHRDLIEDRDKVFCIAASHLNNSNEIHMRTLQTIYKSLTGSKFDCPRIGGHWEEIGFQGTDPSTDLRGAGLLGLLNLLHLLKDPKKMQLASDIYRLSLHPTQNFPFCIMGINLSRITLQSLREGLLNKECNRRNDVFGVVNDFYAALYLQMYLVWKRQGKTIADSGFVIKDIETKSKKNPREVLKQLEDYLNKKPAVATDDKPASFGDENFVNICDDK